MSQGSYASRQTEVKRVMMPAERPGESEPDNADSALPKPSVDPFLRKKTASSSTPGYVT
ncbi:hypothetical protein OAS67_08195 [Alphaproteobacteria bacterium]|nr:hypothetical protein [Alphaproteobacteria bacterium]